MLQEKGPLEKFSLSTNKIFKNLFENHDLDVLSSRTYSDLLKSALARCRGRGPYQNVLAEGDTSPIASCQLPIAKPLTNYHTVV